MTRNENDGRKPRGGSSPRRISAKDKAVPAPDTETKTERQRIAKVMARAGLCSRRDAEAWILEGRVSVNGDILTSPAMDVGADDRVLVDGAPLPAADKTRLFLFHKPRGFITSDHDPEGRATIFDHLREHWPDGPRVVTVGRLDINTEGLLLLTNDGGLARVLELPQTGWVRRYRVRAKGETNQAVLDGLAHGVTIDGIDYAGIEAKLDRIQGANCWLTMGLREGKNREVKRVLEHIGLDVNRLIRLSFGPFQLLDLLEGQVEEVKTRILRDQLGPTLAAEAGVDFSEAEPVAPIVAAPKPERARGKESAPSRDRPVRDRSSADRPAKPFDRAAPAPRGTGGKAPRGTGGKAPRGTTPAPRGRNFRDRDRIDEPAAAPEIRERPVSGPRRHVSALRAETDAVTRTGPRKRLERSDTTDRKNRTVTVERLVASAPAPEIRRDRPRSEPGSHREGNETGLRRERSEATPRRERSEASPRRERSEASPRRERTEGAPRPDAASPRGRTPSSASAGRPFKKEGHLSQSALGKRERIARSGGDVESSTPRPRAARSFSQNRAARSDERGAQRAARAELQDRADSRPPRRDSADAPRPRTKTFSGGKASAERAGSGRPATGRTKSSGAERRFSEKPRDAKPRGAPAAKGFGAKSLGDRPPRTRSSDGGKPVSRGSRPSGTPKDGPRGKKPPGGGRPSRPRG